MPYTANEAFCTIGDVEARVARGPFSGTTIPTQVQVIDFMAKHAAVVQATLWSKGYRKTVPSGSNPFGTPSTDEDKLVHTLAVLANELFAAGDALFAHLVRDGAEAPPEVLKLWSEARATLQDLEAAVSIAVSHGGSRTHVTTGGIAQESFNPQGYDSETDRRDLFTLGDKQ